MTNPETVIDLVVTGLTMLFILYGAICIHDKKAWRKRQDELKKWEENQIQKLKESDENQTQ